MSLFSRSFFISNRVVMDVARRAKSREEVSEVLDFITTVLTAGGKPNKQDVLSRCAMNERKLNYYGGIKGLTGILRAALANALPLMTHEQYSIAMSLGIKAEMDINNALLALSNKLVLAVRRAGWQEFVTLASREDAMELRQRHGLPDSEDLMFVYNDGKGGELPYLPSVSDMTTSDWEPISA
ncbi:Thoeris anti-defense Tad2 family protein [Atlantibacter hermannii]|uniref:Thoeris anti-defense Tad2 family protein n=1 Tax=Atlantibacter hermannii TaxID=565 RepID=UPI00289B13E4|nr:hypothetical protein [Atlantibacter hermannii]